MCLGGNSGFSPLQAIGDVAAVVSGNPEALLAAAATTAGNYIQTQNNNASTKAQWDARNNALAQGAATEQGLQTQANNAFSSTLNNVAPAAQQQSLGDIIASRSAAINGNVTPATGTTNPSTNVSTAPKVVQDDIASKMAAASGYGTQQGNALAALGSTGDQFLQNNLNLQAGTQNVGQIASTAQGQAGVTKALAESAYNNARKSPSILGKGLSDVGTLLGLDSFTGGNAANFITGGNGAGAATNAVVNAANASSPGIKAGLLPKINATQIAQPGWMTD